MTTSYLVAVYSQNSCQYCFPASVGQCLKDLESCSDALFETLPNADALVRIQHSLLDPPTSSLRLLVLVPDNWLSISCHHLDEAIPTKLLPLASLSHAAEVTFSSPETLRFNFQYKKVSKSRFELKVIACSTELAQSLLTPFSSRYKTCVLMSYSQWQALKAREQSWSHLLKHGLSTYQPDQEASKKRKTLWLVLLLVSVLIQMGGYFYWHTLNDLSGSALASQQAIERKQLIWKGAEKGANFALAAFTLFRTLPSSIFPTSFEEKDGVVYIGLVSSQGDFHALQSSWREQYPNWQWTIDVSPSDMNVATPIGDMGLISTDMEVLDVSISIRQNGH